VGLSEIVLYSRVIFLLSSMRTGPRIVSVVIETFSVFEIVICPWSVAL
jgi:hypothetical protein